VLDSITVATEPPPQPEEPESASDAQDSGVGVPEEQSKQAPGRLLTPEATPEPQGAQEDPEVTFGPQGTQEGVTPEAPSEEVPLRESEGDSGAEEASVGTDPVSEQFPKLLSSRLLSGNSRELRMAKRSRDRPVQRSLGTAACRDATCRYICGTHCPASNLSCSATVSVRDLLLPRR
jgi:hypothetical protein